MSKRKVKLLLDLIPLVILMILALRLAWTLATSDFLIEWMNIAGFVLLPAIIALFVWKHQAGVLALGLSLFLGLLGVVSFAVGVSTFEVGLGKDQANTLFKIHGDPVYLLFLLIHFILSGRYYVGILTKKYWKELF